MKITKSKLRKAIMDSGNVIKDVAAMLGCSRGTVYSYLSKWPEMEAVREEAEKVLIEEAVACIRDNVRNGNHQSAMFVLKTRAGWNTTQNMNITKRETISYEPLSEEEYKKKYDAPEVKEVVH